MRGYVFAILCGITAMATGAAVKVASAEAPAVELHNTFSSDGATAIAQHHDNKTVAMWNRLQANVQSILSENMRQNSRKLKLEDFSWGIFSGSRGRLLGLRDYALTQQRSQVDSRRLNMAFGLTVPRLQAVWEKSVCMGYPCAMTIELRDCEFAVRLSVNAARDDCGIDHSAQLLRYGNAVCHADYHRSSPVAVALVEATAQLLGHALNTRPFAKIVADNVNRALLRLPLFNGTDVRAICEKHRLIFS